MPEDEIAPSRSRPPLRAWLFRLLPVALFGSLVFTPLAIWLIKKPVAVFDQMRIGGRVAEVTPADGPGAPVLLTINLDDGTRVAIREDQATLRGGAEVTLLRKTYPDGIVIHELVRD